MTWIFLAAAAWGWDGDLSPRVDPKRWSVERHRQRWEQVRAAKGSPDLLAWGSVLGGVADDHQQPDMTNVCVSPRQNAAWEWTIVVDPTDARRLVAGANHWNPGLGVSSTYHSTDGGMTWDHTPISGVGPYGSWGDPALAFDAAGNLYYASLLGQSGCTYSVAVTKSTDGGATFPSQWYVHDCAAPPSPTPGCFDDKEWIAADGVSGSPYLGRVYMVWDWFPNGLCANGPEWLVNSFSTDQGATWSPPVNVANEGYFATNLVGPGGTYYLAYGDGTQPGLNLRFSRSTNGGASFSASTLVSTIHPNAYYVNPGFDVDRDSSSPYSGRLYLCYADVKSPNLRNHVYVQWSSNGGTTWASPVRINADAGDTKEHRFAWIAVSPSGGSVTAAWYDFRCSSSSGPLGDYVYTIGQSTDGGATWRNLRVQDVSAAWQSRSTCWWEGDYDGIVATDQLLYPIWADARHQPNICSLGWVQPVPNPMPAITGLSPSLVGFGSSNTVTITGQNLAGVARVAFDTPKLHATVVSSSATSISLAVIADPDAPAGAHPWTLMWDVTVGGTIVQAAAKSGCGQDLAVGGATATPTATATSTPTATPVGFDPKLFPNPWTGGEMRVIDAIPGASLSLYSMSGERVGRWEQAEFETELAFEPLSPRGRSLGRGVYVAVLRQPNRPTRRWVVALLPK